MSHSTTPSTKQPRCESCTYYARDAYLTRQRRGDVGYCHHNPPIALFDPGGAGGLGGGPVRGFPLVSGTDDWCSQWSDSPLEVTDE